VFQFSVCPGNVERWWTVAPDVMNIAHSRHRAALMSPWVYQLLSQVRLCACLCVPYALTGVGHVVNVAFDALTLLVDHHEVHLVHKN